MSTVCVGLPYPGTPPYLYWRAQLYYPAILRAIRATGYVGYIGHEFIPKGDPVTALRTTFE